MTALRYEAMEFSPYSRGWSAATAETANDAEILPVFAGMVPLAYA